MSKFSEYDVVRLARDMPEHGLSAGATGAVLMVFDKVSPAEYEVEFLDQDGGTVALVTLAESALKLDDAASKVDEKA